MHARQEGRLILVGVARGTPAGDHLIHAASALALRVEVVGDRESFHRTLADATENHEFSIVICAPHSEAGSAAEVLYDLRAVGGSAAFVGYGRFRSDVLTELLRAGADDVLKPQASERELTMVLRQAAERASRRLHHAQANAVVGEQIFALKKSLREKEEQFTTVRRLATESLMLGLAVREADAIPHSLRVQAFASHLARVADYPPPMCEALEQAALLHDIGKIGISEDVLFRQGWLTQTEVRDMEPHAEFGARIIEQFDFMRFIAPIVQHHHERFDGHGFPDGLIGNTIPVGARIFAIADSLDAMTSDKPYRAAMTFEVAMEEIQRNAGKQFDPQLVEHFLSVGAAVWKNLREQVMNSLRNSPPLYFFPMTTSLSQSV